MKPDQERVRNLLTDTVTLLCKNGLHYQKELRVQGLLGITLDNKDVFVVHINEKFGDLLGGTISLQARDGESTKTTMSDVGSSSEIELPGKMKARNKRKRRRRSGENATPTLSSADDASANQQFLQRPIKRLMTSTPYSSVRFEKRTHSSVNNSADQNEDGPVSESAADADLPPPLDVNVKVKTEDDLMIIDDKSCVQSCDPNAPVTSLASGADPTYPSLSLNEIQSNYQHFEQILGLTDTSGDPGGGDPETKRHVTQDPYGQPGGVATTSTADQLPGGVGGPFIAGGMHHEMGAHDATNSMWDASQISAHNSGFAADGLVNSALPGHSSWNPSPAEIRSAEQIAESFGSESAQIHERLLSRYGARMRRPSVSAEKRFTCDYSGCSKDFYDRRNLLRHQTHKHGRKLSRGAFSAARRSALFRGESGDANGTRRRTTTAPTGGLSRNVTKIV